MRIFAIDPGTNRVGYAFVNVLSEPRALAFGTLSGRAGTKAQRLKYIYKALERLLRRYRPDQVVIERTFVGRNPQAALSLGEGRGVALLAAAQAGAPVFEYAPSEVKKAVAAGARAGKGAVQEMVRLLYALKIAPEPDPADALALAWCHANRLSVNSRLSDRPRGSLRGRRETSRRDGGAPRHTRSPSTR